MIGQNKTIFPKKEISKAGKVFQYGLIGSFGGIAIYLLGFTAYASKYDALIYPKEYTDLRNKKIELVRKIDEWQRFIPLMDKQFIPQYEDSLENAVRDTNETNLRIAKIKEEHNKIADKTSYSWLAFFMKD